MHERGRLRRRPVVRDRGHRDRREGHLAASCVAQNAGTARRRRCANDSECRNGTCALGHCVDLCSNTRDCGAGTQLHVHPARRGGGRDVRRLPAGARRAALDDPGARHRRMRVALPIPDVARSVAVTFSVEDREPEGRRHDRSPRPTARIASLDPAGLSTPIRCATSRVSASRCSRCRRRPTPAAGRRVHADASSSHDRDERRHRHRDPDGDRGHEARLERDPRPPLLLPQLRRASVRAAVRRPARRRRPRARSRSSSTSTSRALRSDLRARRHRARHADVRGPARSPRSRRARRRERRRAARARHARRSASTCSSCARCRRSACRRSARTPDPRASPARAVGHRHRPRHALLPSWTELARTDRARARALHGSLRQRRDRRPSTRRGAIRSTTATTSQREPDVLLGVRRHRSLSPASARSSSEARCCDEERATVAVALGALVAIATRRRRDAAADR